MHFFPLDVWRQPLFRGLNIGGVVIIVAPGRVIPGRLQLFEFMALPHE